jgi:predicted glycogen debranching enzyme
LNPAPANSPNRNTPLTELTDSREWLEPDGLGGYASGTASGLRTRRYHGLLLTATTPPTGRVMLVNGCDAWIDTGTERLALSSQRYLPDVVAPDARPSLRSLTCDPWPTWLWSHDSLSVSCELFVPHGISACLLRWQLAAGSTVPGGRRLRVVVRPFLSSRDYHGTQHENPAFRFAATPHPLGVTWQPYQGLPAVTALTNGTYQAESYWYRNFLYTCERERGLDFAEDLASPGTFTMDLEPGAVLIFAAEGHVEALTRLGASANEIAGNLVDSERQRRAAFANRLARSADAYLVRRDGPATSTGSTGKTKADAPAAGRTIIAGYPWFTDWGRDTFIALRGLCLAGRRLTDAADILGAWAGTISEGMLPNRFPDLGAAAEYNSVDASLWYIVAVDDFLQRAKSEGPAASPALVQRLTTAVGEILNGYHNGTRYGIRCDADGLLRAGVPGEQLTWMDVKIGDWVVTPRIGKPVEVAALWLAALKIGAQFDSRWGDVYTRGRQSFRARFWNESQGALYDVVDADHQAGTLDASIRPNQLFAVGGLPENLLDAGQARRVVDLVEQRLWTPLGPRSLDPADPRYAPHYDGPPSQRDPAYHQGTVWPWLAGAFIEAWVRVRGNSPEARALARTKFLEPLLQQLDSAGLGHLPEVADGEPPHTPRGCPFQAWSLGELLRVQTLLASSTR